MAEFLLRNELEKRWGIKHASAWEVTSAGTNALAGASMHPLATEVLSQLDIDGTDFQTRLLTEEMVHDADLVLTATRDHRARAVMLSPSAVRRTFTLRQFTRLVATTTDAGSKSPLAAGQEMVRRAVVGRSLLQPTDPGADNLADPIGRRVDAFRESAQIMKKCFEELLDVTMTPVEPDLRTSRIS